MIECRPRDAIVGGEEAVPHSIPWQVIIMMTMTMLMMTMTAMMLMVAMIIQMNFR